MVVATALFGFSCLNATYRLLNWTGNFVYNCYCARAQGPPGWLLLEAVLVVVEFVHARTRGRFGSFWGQVQRWGHAIRSRDRTGRPIIMVLVDLYNIIGGFAQYLKEKNIYMVVFNNSIQIIFAKVSWYILYLKYNTIWNSKYAGIFYEKSECEDSQISMWEMNGFFQKHEK